MLSLGAFSLFTPWALAGFALLPVVWWLIRLTPTRPQRVRFPAIRLLAMVDQTSASPHTSPWWLIVLRLTMISLLLLAAARPIHNPESRLQDTGPLLLVIDDGWAAAKDWHVRIQQAESLIFQAERQNRNVMVLTTAPTLAQLPPGVMNPTEAIARVRSLQPKPWPVDRQFIADQTFPFASAGQVVWLSDGLQNHEDGRDLKQALAALTGLGPVRLIEPVVGNTAHAVYPPQSRNNALHFPVRRAHGDGVSAITLVAYDDERRAIGNATARFDEGYLESEAVFDLPLELRNRMASIRIDSERTAGGIMLMDERWRRRPVGVVSDNTLADDQPLLSDAYFLDRALHPVSDVFSGALVDLLDRDMAVLVMADPVGLSSPDQKKLETWVEAGGVLLVFAGPRMADTSLAQSVSKGPLSGLLPVPLRLGDRAMGGAMSWRRPAGVAAFDANSPFYGLAVADDVRVRRQVLAEPTLELEEKTWARLADGTPLVTADVRGLGRTVLFHVGANAEWSTLPISGLFVEMLQRIVGLSRGIHQGGDNVVLEPSLVLDGFGSLMVPKAGVSPMTADDLSTSSVSPRHPPGFYGSDDGVRAFNLTASLGSLTAIGEVPAGIEQSSYRQGREIDLMPWLLVLAMVLFAADLMISVGVAATLTKLGFGNRAITGVVVLFVVLVAVLISNSTEANAADDDDFIEAANNTRLAYVLSGDADSDEISRLGLRGLSAVLAQRTAVELAAPAAVDPEEDELAFYPLIYWPVTQYSPVPSVEAAARVNAFMANGGTILFDMQQSSAAAGLGQLRRFARVLDIPRLVPIPGDHVLTRSYYLMNDFPGRWAGGRVWVVPADERVNDGVSTVIAGGHHWAGAWALDDASQPMFAAVPGGERQREFAFRFGVNLVMYVLTGNYKGDQVHLPTILDRLN
ncbi:MAG: DUF4159 domain-containing protein [Rhodospirillales bacterium]|jgi:hypothetical protein|nr:DUF4159 domain-containing protein [Rhodospirillales bacterium]MBT4040240.1 DUF4159 domain-containing protein [Rhodospirillales bacterium]MBT4625891.1 DUF4159 domain-containing protein [Rhodospirillales bacterium]MBT5352327.1 DUF4159 domain-containing protein [Rhodospirillales bacterium]MBT6111636.1 DUF4159 domain-containing protein [Rhodospirillales bacterium]